MVICCLWLCRRLCYRVHYKCYCYPYSSWSEFWPYQRTSVAFSTGCELAWPRREKTHTHRLPGNSGSVWGGNYTHTNTHTHRWTSRHTDTQIHTGVHTHSHRGHKLRHPHTNFVIGYTGVSGAQWPVKLIGMDRCCLMQTQKQSYPQGWVSGFKADIWNTVELRSY